MANRNSKPRLSSKDLDGGSKLSAEELLNYLIKPLYLPPYNSNFQKYQRDFIQSIEFLLEEALDTILPSRVTGVQFIFAKRPASSNGEAGGEEIGGNFSFPILLRSNQADAKKLADGIAWVTEYLIREKASFHLRVRKYGLTDFPSVCIYSHQQHDSDGDTSDHESTDGTLVLWVSLPKSEEGRTIVYPDEHLRKIRQNLFAADVHSAIKSGVYSHSQASSENTPSFDNLLYPVRDPTLGAIPAKKRGLKNLSEEIAGDREYLDRVSYLLNLGDVILCTPHAYHPEEKSSDGNSEEIIIDAGLTVIIESGSETITQDDWMRVQVVAQKLAIFAGASLSTAGEAKTSFLQTLADGFGHEYQNLEATIKAVLDTVNFQQKSLSSEDVLDIEGRLEFTKQFIQASIESYKIEAQSELNKTNVMEMLSNLIKPLEKYKDTFIEKDFEDIAAPVSVMKPWQAIITELLRNAYKHGPTTYGEEEDTVFIRVSTVSHPNGIVVSILNELDTRLGKTVKKESKEQKGIVLTDSLIKTLNGTIERIEDTSGNTYTARVFMPCI